MRKHLLDITIRSNKDLTHLSSKRVQFTTKDGLFFKVTSTLKFYRSERPQFLYRFLNRRMKIHAISGNCSSPDGYIFD